MYNFFFNALLTYKHHLQYNDEKTYLQYFALRYLLTFLQYTIITYFGLPYIHITLLEDLQYAVITHLQKKKTRTKLKRDPP